MDVRYIDTSMFEDKGKPEELEFKRTNPKKLRELTAFYLNAQIQEAVHSSVSSKYILKIPLDNRC